MSQRNDFTLEVIKKAFKDCNIIVSVKNGHFCCKNCGRDISDFQQKYGKGLCVFCENKQ